MSDALNTKTILRNELAELNVEFPLTATVPQLRALLRTARGLEDSTSNENRPEAVDTTLAQPHGNEPNPNMENVPVSEPATDAAQIVCSESSPGFVPLPPASASIGDLPAPGAASVGPSSVAELPPPVARVSLPATSMPDTDVATLEAIREEMVMLKARRELLLLRAEVSRLERDTARGYGTAAAIASSQVAGPLPVTASLLTAPTSVVPAIAVPIVTAVAESTIPSAAGPVATSTAAMEPPAASGTHADALQGALSAAIGSMSISSLPEAAGSRPTISINDVRGIIKTYSGQAEVNVVEYLDQAERFLSTMSTSDVWKFMALRSCLTGAAESFLLGSDCRTYEGLRDALIREFSRTWTHQEVYNRLRARKWNRASESPHHYAIEMRRIADLSGLPESELVNCVIQGMELPAEDETLLFAGTPDGTVVQLRNAIQRHERRIMDNAGRAASTSRATSARTTTSGRQPARTGAAGSSVNSSTRCQNCRRTGHAVENCPHPKRPADACYRCWKSGHRLQSCPNESVFRTQRFPASVVAAVIDETAEPGENCDDTVQPVNKVGIVFTTRGFNQNEHSRLMNSLFDTGSPISFIRQSSLPQECQSAACELPMRGVGNGRIVAMGKVAARITFRHKSCQMFLAVLPCNAMRVPMLLGRDFLESMCIDLNLNKQRGADPENKLLASAKSIVSKLPDVLPVEASEPASVAPRARHQPELIARTSELRPVVDDTISSPASSISFDATATPPNEFTCPVIFTGEVELGDRSVTHELPEVNISTELPDADRRRVYTIIHEHYIAPVNLVVAPHEMSIKLTNDTPFYASPRRLSYHEKEEVRKTLDRLLANKIIQPSRSPYASAVVLVKKDGSTRMCVDFRPLNRLTVRSTNHPLPLISDCLDYLAGKKWFTSLDLKDGFFHVKMAPDSVKYTSFVVPQGQFEYLRMPFGLKCAPMEFQKFIAEIFQDLISQNKIIVYMDDLLLGTVTFEEHCTLLAEVLRRIAEKDLELKLSKCRFVCSQIDYLGFTVNHDGVRPNDGHIKAITALSYPKNVKELQSQLGLFQYFRVFVKSFSDIAKPLRSLTVEGTPFIFNERCREAYDELKRRLVSGPILALYDHDRETELHCDASKLGFGATLMQRQPDGKFHPVSYFSQAATPAESRYHSFELETLAMIYALRKFRVYLQGKKFLIATDCNSLKLTLERKQMNPRIARWALELQGYDYTLQHRPGIHMSHVDALSRCHEPAHDIAKTVEVSVAEEVEADINCRIVAAVDEEETSFHVQVAQSRDPQIVKLREKLEREPVTGFQMNNGLIFKDSTPGRPQLYVPAEMEDNVIRVAHETIGHMAVDKTVNRLRLHYWFPSMTTKVARFISNCIKCIMYAAPVKASARELHSIRKEPVPFDTLHIDHFGPLPAVKSSRKHILVVVDSFSKITKLYPVSSTSTKEVIACLEKFAGYYGRPRRIISDQGTCFTSLEFASRMKEWNIEHVKVAVGSPQANGQVERANRVIKSILGKTTESSGHTDWVKKLPVVEYALNNTKHSSTGYSASELLFGVRQRGPSTDPLSEFIEREFQSVTRLDLPVVRADAERNIDKSQRYNEDYIAERSTLVRRYAVGDFVVMTNVDVTIGTNKKLVPKYRGPYVVYKVIGNDRYAIKDIDGCQLTQKPYDNIIEAARLRPWAQPMHSTSVEVESAAAEEVIGTIMLSGKAEL